MSVGFSELLFIFLHLSVSCSALKLDVHAPQVAIEAPGLLKTGPKREAGLDFFAGVPHGVGPFPVIVLLHQLGKYDGGETERIAILGTFMARMKRAASAQIVIAPEGANGAWNIRDEPTDRDDVTLIGTWLVNYLSHFSNVNPRFTFVGFSNGAGLVNRILIENDNPQITTLITCGSQLNKYQFHDGGFHIGGTDNSYKALKDKLIKRRVLQLTGDRDELVPAAGGLGSIQLPVLSWDESAFQLAKAFGYKDAAVRPVDDARGFQAISYLEGQLTALNFKNVSHELWDMFSVGVIEPFLLGEY